MTIKNLTIVLGSLELGGAERQAFLLINHLAKYDFIKVQVVGFSSPGMFAELCDKNSIPWRIFPLKLSKNPLHFLGELIRFARDLRRERPEVIVSYTNLPNVICGIVWRFTGAKKFIWNQRDTGIERTSKLLERIAILNTRNFIANSNHGLEYMIKGLKIKKEYIHVIYNGVNLDTAICDRKVWRNNIGIGENTILVCMVGNLSMHKDHETLLKAWQYIHRNNNKKEISAMLLLAGRFDNNYDKLRDLCSKLEISKSVLFLGAIIDITGLLKSVDIGVFSSNSEGMPNGVLECMAAGLPVIATDIPSIREALGAEGYNYLIKPEEPQMMAEKIQILLKSPDLRINVGKKNQVRVSTEFSPQKMLNQMLEVIIQD